MYQTLSIDPAIKSDAFQTRPTTIRVSHFNDGAAATFGMQLQQAVDAGQSIVPIVIASYGGNIDALFEMLSAIEAAKAAGAIVSTYTPSHAMSCGAVMLAAGSAGYRYASPHASIMVHQVTGVAFGKASDVATDARDVDAANRRFLAMLSRYCGRKKDYWRDRIYKAGNTDIYLDPKEAQTEGIVDTVATPTLDVRVRVELSIVTA